MKVISVTLKITELDIDNINSLHAAGNSINNISNITGITRTEVTEILSRNLLIDGPFNDPVDIIRLYKAGFTAQQIAPRFGVSDNTVRRRLKAAGVTIKQGAEYRAGTRDGAITKKLRTITNYVSPTHIGPIEKDFARLLDDMGIGYWQQFPVGHYNADFALKKLPIVIEIVSGGGDKNHVQTKFERGKFFLDSGYHIIEVRCSDSPNGARPTLDGVKKIIALANSLSSDPTTPRKYRVIRGNGKTVSLRGANRDRWAAIEAL